MATFTINTQKHGKLEFMVATNCTGFGYVYLWDNDKKEYDQICENGGRTGSCIYCKESRLAKVARKWWRVERDWLKKIDEH